MFPTKETIEMLRTEYPDGTRVRLVKMDDVQAPPHWYGGRGCRC